MNKREFEKAQELVGVLDDAQDALDGMPERGLAVAAEGDFPALAFELVTEDAMLRAPVPAEMRGEFYDQMRQALQDRVDDARAKLADLGVDA